VLPTLFPWFPSQAKKRQKTAAIGIYNMISEIIDDRAKSGRKENDTLQNLIDIGKTTQQCCHWITAALFAAIVNTGIA